MIFLVTVFGFCKTKINISGQDQIREETKELASENGPPIVFNNINPEDCRIRGRIVSIDSIDRTERAPCNEFPCYAQIEVLEIEGYGSSFQAALDRGDLHKIKFIYSLSPTEESYPSKQPPLSGLVEGDVFRADVTAGIGIPSSGPLTISNYLKL